MKSILGTGRLTARRIAQNAGLLALSSLAVGCLDAPPPDTKYNELDASGEVFRVFCRRVAKAAYPLEMSGEQFYPECDGFEADGTTPMDPDDETNDSLRALLRRRPEIIATLDRAFGITPADDGGLTFEKNELSGFLQALVPLYDKPNETIPTATRGIAQLLGQLTDPTDARANKVLDTIARLVLRKGYRNPDMNIGAVRALFTYPNLDTLSQKLLPVISSGGSAHDEWVDVLNSAGLELADDPVVPADLDGTTLHTALGLLLKEDATQKSGNLPAVPILQRVKGSGDALPADGASGDLPTPFPVVGTDDNAQRDANGLAQLSGKPAYQTYDATQTLLAALMRETSLLIGRGDADRSPLENFAHGIKAILGEQGPQTYTIGKNNYAFTGPDVSDSPLMDLAHVASLVLQYPETDALLQTLDALIRNHENEATGFDYSAMHIADLSKMSDFDGAKLNGPHEFWDDLIAAGERMNQRPGLFDALIRSFDDARSGDQGALFATWMRYKDEVSYPNSPSTDPTDINKPVVGTYSVPVDRSQPDVGMNRSIWQRTMSLINALNGVQVCNKAGAILNVNTGIGLLTFPFGDVSMMGYKECDLIQIQDAVEIYAKALVKGGGFAIKDSFASVLSVLGSVTGISGTVGQITETESKITGFTDTPTPQSLARFIFAPRNKWLNDLFDPQLTKDNLPIAQYEPDALFIMEMTDAMTPSGGKPDNFLDIGFPLVKAFNDKELRTPPPVQTLTDGYMFGHLLSIFHKHWPQRKTDPCPAMVEAGNEGCTQSLDPTMPLYSAQTGLVTYEELLAQSLGDQGLVVALHNATVALEAIKITTVDGQSIDGVTALANFVSRVLTPDPTLKKRNGDTTSASNLCQVQNGMCANGQGRFIPVLSPMVMLGDALKRFDDAFKESGNAERLQPWHDGRSGILDQVLSVDKAADGTFKLRDRTAYNIAMSVLPWAIDLLNQHRQAGDLAAWSADLSNRATKILSHPLADAVVDLLDAFWPEADASGEFTAVASYMTNEANQSSYIGLLTGIADSLTLLDRDANLSPAIQFAALGLAPNAFQAVDGMEAPNGDKSVVYAGLELTGGVVKQLQKTQKNGEQTSLSKLLNNAAIGDATVRSPLEVLIDATADVNRTQMDASPDDPLSADEDRTVFGIVQTFLHDDSQDQRSLERLYTVIQGRNLK